MLIREKVMKVVKWTKDVHAVPIPAPTWEDMRLSNDGYARRITARDPGDRDGITGDVSESKRWLAYLYFFPKGTKVPHKARMGTSTGRLYLNFYEDDYDDVERLVETGKAQVVFGNEARPPKPDFVRAPGSSANSRSSGSPSHSSSPPSKVTSINSV